MKNIILDFPGFDGIIFNMIELMQKFLFNSDSMYIIENENFSNTHHTKFFDDLKKRYVNFNIKSIPINNKLHSYHYITTITSSNFLYLINDEKVNNIFIFRSANHAKWYVNILKSNIEIIKKIITNPNIYILNNYNIFYNNMEKNIIFPQKNILNFTHGIYPKYYNENLPKVNKYYMYLEGRNFYKKHIFNTKTKVPYNQKDIEKTLQWCKQNNIDVDVNIPCINPAYQYDGLIYCRDFEHCSRLINEFLYYKKPIWIMKYNEGLDYYIPNAKNMEYPFLLKRDYIEIDVEDRFNELIK